MSLLTGLASNSEVSDEVLRLAIERADRARSICCCYRQTNNNELVHARGLAKSNESERPAFSTTRTSSSPTGSTFSDDFSTPGSTHSRQRIDETRVDPQHAKRLEKSRKYQANKRAGRALAAEVDDEGLEQLLLSKEGRERFPKVSAAFAQNQAQAAAAQAVKSMVESLPKKSAHKQAIVGKLRGLMTAKQVHDFFQNVSDRYARKAAAAVRKVEEDLKAGRKPEKQDIFTQEVMTDARRDKVTLMEKRITADYVKEHLGAKSGSNAAFWYGNLDSFHDWYRTDAHPNIYKRLCSESGGWRKLVENMNGGKWVTDNAQAMLCEGKCVQQGSSDVCHHFYRPRSRPTVASILREQEVFFRCVSKTVPCKWHDNWEKWKKELTRLEQQVEKDAKTAKKIRKLKNKVAKCQRHDDQYQVQRRYAFLF